MKTMKKYLKRALTAVLSATMSISGLPFIMPDVHAATAPSLQYFAAKDDWKNLDLTDDSKSIKINLGSVPETIEGAYTQPIDLGLIVGKPLTWWVVGSDSSTANLYSDKPIFSSYFDTSSAEKSYSTSWGCSYGSSVPNSVYMTHYGGSHIRNILKTLHSTLFKQIENNLIETSTINCWDNLAQKTYTVSDRLYLPSGGSETHDITYGGNAIYVPDSDSNINNSIPLRRYAGAPRSWLRTASGGESAAYALVLAYGSNSIGHNAIQYHPDNSGTPACGINLSSVLFSSSAPKASEATGGKALPAYDSRSFPIHNLRLKDTSNTSQSIQTNAEFTKIRAINVPTSSEYYLMVQGVADNGTNWAYSTKITDGKAMLQTSDISAVASISSFENAKVWIEKASTETDGQLLYASEPITISSSTDKFDDKAPCVKSVTLTHQKDGKDETYTPGNWATNPITVTYNVEDLASTGVTPSGIDIDSYQISLDGGTSYSKATDSIDGVEVLSRTDSELQLKVTKEGQFRLKIRVQDKEGNFTESEINSLNIDMTPPAPVKITSPEGDTWLKTKTPTISGTGEKGCTVHIKEGDTILGSPEVSEDGTWQLTLDPLSEWIHRLTITQTDPAGQTSGAAKINFIINTEGFAGKIVITDDARVYWIRPGDKSVFKKLNI